MNDCSQLCTSTSSVLFSMNKDSFKDAGQEPKGFSGNNDGRKSFRSDQRWGEGGGVERGVKIKKSAGAAALSDRSVLLILIIVRSSLTRS